MRKAASVLMCMLLFVTMRRVSSDQATFDAKVCGDKYKGNERHMLAGIHRPFWAPNHIGTYIGNDGQFVSSIPTGNAGMEWPVGSGNTINFASGIRFAGIKAGEIVTAVAEYSTEFQPGNVRREAVGAAGTPADPSDPRFRVYVIDESDLANPASNPDYVNWPANDGAPVDKDGKPLLLGTSTTWAVFNDFDETLHARLYGSKPMGVEVQMTAWAYDWHNAFSDMMFLKFKCINKSGRSISDSYVAFWADIDIGQATNDLVGCDTALDLGYMYKTERDDQYGVNPPAIGYDLLQGPMVPAPGDTAFMSGRRIPDFRNLPMTAFLKYT